MTRILYVLLFSAAAILLELLARSFGLFLPFFACLIFYFSSAFPIKLVLVASIFGSIVLDFTAGYSFPVSVISTVIISYAGEFWTHRVMIRSFIFHILPGAVIPLVFYIPGILLHCGWIGLPQFAPHLLLSSLFTAITLPLWFFLFHFWASRAELEMDEKERREEEEN